MRLTMNVFRPLFMALALCAFGSAAAGSTPRAQRAVAHALSSPAKRATTAPYGFSSIRARFEHSLICDDGILIANYAHAYGASTIFVQLGGDDVASLLVRNPQTVKNFQAMIAVAKVYVVIGDPSWLASPTSVPAAAAQAAAIARAYPQIAGVLYDVDPAATPAWNSNQRQMLVQEYLTLASTLLAMPGATSFKQTQFVADTQFATTHVGGNPRAPTVLQDVQSLSGISGFQLQVAGNSANAQMQNASASLAQLTLPYTIVSTESKYGPNTYFAASPSYLQGNLAAVGQAAASANANFAGIGADGWNDLYNGLQSVLPQPPVYTGTLASGPLVPPPGSIYLGAFVNPLHTRQTAPQTTAFEQSIGRPLAFDLHFYGWKQSFPTGLEQEDVKHGRLPVIAWNCSELGDERVAHGDDDALIGSRAEQVKHFGAPVMIRWFWEMNLNDLNDPPRTQCWDPKSDLPGGYFAPMHYIAAWQHIRAVFAAHGVTNAIWLWSVANAHGGPAQYYPGDAYVDWIGMDDYDTNDVSLASMLYIPSNAMSQFQNKPVMLVETGAHANDQQTFLSAASSTLSSQYPWIRAVGYLDAEGTQQTWTLTGAGLSAFAAFGQDPYLGAMPSLKR
jgi:hypothetical protein